MSRQVNRDVIALWCGRARYLAVCDGGTRSPQGLMVFLQGQNGFDSAWMRRYSAASLLFEAERDRAHACHYITQAADMQVVEDYMGWVAIVHQHLRRWALG